MIFTIITTLDEEEGDYIAEIKELDCFGNGKTEFEAVKEATKLILEKLSLKYE